MPIVWADDEEVIFQEGIPDNSQKIYELMMGALGEQRKAVVEFIVDGTDALSANSFPKNFQEIRAKSMSHDEITLRLAEATLSKTENLDQDLDAYSKNILSTPWSAVFKQMDDLINKIQPFADLIDNVAPYSNAYKPSWSDSLDNLTAVQANSLNGILKAFESHNPASLSDEISHNFLPLIKKIKKLFTEEIMPQLQSAVEVKT